MDNWNILLENTNNGFTVATVVEFLALKSKDKTKQGAISALPRRCAIEKVRYLLEKRLAKAEIIKIPVATKLTLEEKPLMKFAGIFENDPDFQDIVENVKVEREDNKKSKN